MQSRMIYFVPGTAAVRRRRQSMKPQVEVESMNHIDPPPIALRAAAAAKAA